jgi:hypothetical protein
MTVLTSPRYIARLLPDDPPVPRWAVFDTFTQEFVAFEQPHAARAHAETAAWRCSAAYERSLVG